MQRFSTIRRLLLAVGSVVTCAVLCLAMGGALAWAVDAGTGGTNELEVYTVREADLEDNADLASTPVTVHLYKVASYTKDPNYDTYNYTFDVEAFKDFASKYPQAEMNADKWEAMAEEAAAIVEDNNVTPTANATTALVEGEGALADITGLEDGIYLILADDATSSTTAYTFTSAIASLPGKVDKDGNAVYTTWEGRWTNTDPVVPVEVALKHEEEPLYGDLVINKTVDVPDLDNATFVFHVIDTATQGDVFNEYVAVQYTGGGFGTTTYHHIPAGMELSVEEQYTGARYEIISGPMTATIVANDEVSVGFTNQYRGGPMGHGVENRYTYSEEDGDWIIEPRVFDASESHAANAS